VLPSVTLLEASVLPNAKPLSAAPPTPTGRLRAAEPLHRRGARHTGSRWVPQAAARHRGARDRRRCGWAVWSQRSPLVLGAGAGCVRGTSMGAAPAVPQRVFGPPSQEWPRP